MPSRPCLAKALCLSLLLLALTACGHVPTMLGGSADVELRLDGEQKHEAQLPPGNQLILDMRDPSSSGYVFAGASFDPALLRLDSLEPAANGKRVVYRFQALAPGQCDVIIKIRKAEPGYRPDDYKRIRVTIAP